MRNLYDVRQTAERCGNKFFSRDAMRFWNSRTCDSLTRVSYVDGSVWFVTSEDMGEGRRYTVRRAVVTYTACSWANRKMFQSWSHHGAYGEVVSRSENPELAQDSCPVWGMTFTIDTVGEFMQHMNRREAYKALVRDMLAGVN